MTASFTISLDFELRWGMRDNPHVAAYEDSILGGRRAIPKMLDLFQTHKVAVTWATVGFLFADNRDRLMDHLPSVRPNYVHKAFSPFADVADLIGKDEVDDPLHFAPSLIRQIADTPRQEVGSHTFSHFYCLENGGSPDAFGADMAAAQAIGKEQGIKLESLVLPRNQLSAAHLKKAKESGIKVFRGNPDASFYKASARTTETKKMRALRLADSVVPLTNTLTRPRWDAETALADTPASRFLRPVMSVGSLMAKGQRRRIMSEMTQAAKHGMNYHLWWHPHNFGRATDANLEHLDRILTHFDKLRGEYGMQALTMRDLANTIARPRAEPVAS